MTTRSKVTVSLLNGGLGRREPNLDGVAGLITTGVATANLTLGTIYELHSLLDLEALLVDAAYDTTNVTLIHHHVKRFFMRNPSGELHLMVLAQTVTLTAMLDVANTNNAKKLLKDLAGRVKILGVVRNPASGYTATLTTGLDGDVITAITKAKALYEEEFAQYRFASIIIEGRSFNGTAGSALDLRAISNVSAPGVSVTILSDPAIAAGNTLYNGYAAVGDVLGIVSKAAVSQNIGERIPEFNLSVPSEDAFDTCGLSSNLAVSTYTDASLDTIATKGYIFGEIVPGMDGFFLNDSSTCCAASSDYAFLENNRTIHKMVTLARLSLLPSVNSRLKINSDTGYMLDIERTRLESTVRKSLAGMEADGDLSGGIDCWIEPEQNLLQSSNLYVQLTAVIVAIGRTITLKVGFENPLAA